MEHVRSHNQTFTLKEVEKIADERISVVTLRTRNKVEDHFSEKEDLYERMMEAFIIDVGNQSDKSSSSSEIPVLKRNNLFHMYAPFLQALI